MIRLLSNDEWLQFETDDEIISYLSRNIVSSQEQSETPPPLYALAQRFRPVVQARAISLFPVETIVELTPHMRDILYSSHPEVDEWNALPPLVVVARNGVGVPESSWVKDEETVWVIDWSSSRALLDSLHNYQAISLDRVDSSEPAWTI